MHDNLRNDKAWGKNYILKENNNLQDYYVEIHNIIKWHSEKTQNSKYCLNSP